MPVEIELKIPVADLATVRSRLVAAEAHQLHGPLREVNLLLDSADHGVAAAGRVLRLRSVGERHLLTLKGPPSFHGALKEREELELEVADQTTMVALLERLGYRTVLRYDKDRESWRLGSTVVTLDHTPMGDFVEIEGPRTELHLAATSIGLDPGAAVHGSYVSLWHDYRRDHPELGLPSDMVFQE